METRTIFKLTDQEMRTYGGCQWIIGEWKESPGEGHLCGPGWLHSYDDSLLAILLNPIHANIRDPRLFRGEAKGRQKTDLGLKFGDQYQRLLEELPVPEITTTQRAAFGVLCALEVTTDPVWRAWAERWLSGEDRSKESAWEAWAAWAAWEARAAARAAESAAFSEVAWTESAAWAAARASQRAAARASERAERAANGNLDLKALASKAMDVT